MTSFELVRSINVVLQELDRLTSVTSYLQRLGKEAESLEDVTTPILLANTGQSPSNQSVDSLKSRLSKVIALTKDMKNSLLFANFLSLRSALDDWFGSVNAYQSDFHKIVILELDDFRDKYDIFLNSRGIAEAFSVTQSAHRLWTSLSTLANTLRVIGSSLREERQPTAEAEYFEILIGSAQSLAEVSAKSRDFSEVYEELCQVHHLSSDEFPLQLVKVETGSFLLEIAGHPAVIATLTAVVTAAIAYFHNRFTQLGRVESLPKEVAAADSVLGLRNKLKEQGIDTAITDAVLAKVLVKISQHLEDALAYEPKIEVQGQRFEVPTAVQVKMLAERKEKKLIGGVAPDGDIGTGNP